MYEETHKTFTVYTLHALWYKITVTNPNFYNYFFSNYYKLIPSYFTHSPNVTHNMYWPEKQKIIM